VVWLIDPLAPLAVTMRPAEPPEETGPGGGFSAAPVLPGLEIDLDDLLAPFRGRG
jgi:hypothetical protein